MDNYDPNNGNQNDNNFNHHSFHNSNPYHTPNNWRPQQPAAPKDHLALFSLLLGIAGIFSSMIYYVGIPCTVSAIVLAILSRNRRGRFEGKAVAGLCLGISGICLTIFFFTMMLTMLQNPELMNYMQEYMQNYLPQQ